MGRHWSDALKRVTEADRLDRQILFRQIEKMHVKVDYSEALRNLVKQEDERIFRLLMRKLNPMRGQA